MVAVPVAADSSRLLQDCRQAFAQWTGTLAAALKAAGLPPAQAASFATLLMAAVLGAILLSRAARDMAPFDPVAGQFQYRTRLAGRDGARLLLVPALRGKYAGDRHSAHAD